MDILKLNPDEIKTISKTPKHQVTIEVECFDIAETFVCFPPS